MKKLIAIMLLAPIAAPAAKMCMKWTTAACSYTSNSGNHTWSMTCNGQAYNGRSACLTNPNNSGVGIAGIVPSESDINYTSGGKSCYCQMTSPAIGPWVYARDNVNAESCAGCESHCAYFLGSTGWLNFRFVVFQPSPL